MLVPLRVVEQRTNLDAVADLIGAATYTRVDDHVVAFDGPLPVLLAWANVPDAAPYVADTSSGTIQVLRTDAGWWRPELGPDAAIALFVCRAVAEAASMGGRHDH